MSDDRDDLEARIAELEATLRDLQTELGRPPRGPFGLPRPPTPREVLSFTGEYAIPTLIAILETNIRALQMLQGIIRLLDPERDSTRGARSELGARAGRASRATLDHLETALSEIETALSEGDLPQEPTARKILEDARRLGDDIREEVSEGRRRADAERRGRTDRLGEPDDSEEFTEIDIESELSSIRDEMDRVNEGVDVDWDDDEGEDEGDGNGTDDADEGSVGGR